MEICAPVLNLLTTYCLILFCSDSILSIFIFLQPRVLEGQHYEQKWSLFNFPQLWFHVLHSPVALFKHCGRFHEYKITRKDRLVELRGGHPKCFLVWLLFVSRNCCQLVGVKIAEHYQQFLTCISICISSCTFCVCIC